MDYDVIILGTGSMGIAAGYYLSKQGKRILLLDAHNPPHAERSHHGETRIIRYAYGEGESYVAMALRAQVLGMSFKICQKKSCLSIQGSLRLRGRNPSLCRTSFAAQKLTG